MKARLRRRFVPYQRLRASRVRSRSSMARTTPVAVASRRERTRGGGAPGAVASRAYSACVADAPLRTRYSLLPRSRRPPSVVAMPALMPMPRSAAPTAESGTAVAGSASVDRTRPRVNRLAHISP